jgi:hypothetical protein
MNEFDHFKGFILYTGDVTVDVHHLHVKKIHLVSFSYIVIEDLLYVQYCIIIVHVGQLYVDPYLCIR